MKVISLISGGPDSILVADKLLSEGNEVLLLFVAHNQNPMTKEREAAEYFVDLFYDRYPHKVEYLEQIVDLKGTKPVESAWGRTLLLLGCAMAYNYSQRDMYYDAIAFGGHQGDKGPDVRPENQEAFAKVVEVSSKGTMQLLYPIADLDLEHIGIEFAARNLPLHKTYNCYWATPCGYRSPNDNYRCQGCRRKVVSMRAAGYSPKELLLPNTQTITFQSPLAEKVDY